MIYIAIFILGAIIGSFLNVCIYRIPEGLSIVSPSSRCSSCGTPIKFYDNIPILSYIFLLGRCRSCRTRLSIQYPLVEFINAVLYVMVLQRFGYDSPWVLIVYLIFISSLVVIFFIDLKHQIIPNSITLPGIPVAIILGSAILPDPVCPDGLLGFRASIAGALAGGGGFYCIAVLGKLIFRKEAMGGGDIKMMAMVGGLLGWQGVLMTTFLASFTGSIIGVLLILFKGKEWGSRIPFGPYLALGTIISLLWGHHILNWLHFKICA